MPAPKQANILEAMGLDPNQSFVDIRMRNLEAPEIAQRDHERGLLVLKIAAGLSGAALALAVFLCWLFLYYGKPEQAEKVVATMVGVIGGFGLGRASINKD